MYDFETYDKPGEKCAVAGIISQDNASNLAEEALRSMQHRGQEASGIAAMADDGTVNAHRELGLVRDVFLDPKVLNRLIGDVAIGHNRYTTNGDKDKHAQPVIDESIGFAFAHNGNLPVTNQLEKELKRHNVLTPRLNDSEMMARIIATHIRDRKSLPKSIMNTYDSFQGSFSCVAMHDGQMAAFRDSKGIRPLSLGRMSNNSWIVASETCAIDAVGARIVGDIMPGQMAILSPDSLPEYIQLAEGEEKLDIFEFVYFARPDSVLYGERVNEVRRRFGEELADQHKEHIPDDAIVVPVPDTSIPAAEGFAESLGLRVRQAIVKDRYVGRTFILPEQREREKQLNIKHNIIPEAVKGRDVVVIDDSIVKLNTIPRIVKKLMDAGARSVIVLIASPPVRYSDFYGIDTPDQSELAAFSMNPEEMRRDIEARYLGFLSLGGMIRATRSPADRFNLSCFNGEYPIPIGKHAKTLHEPVSREYID